MRHEPICSHKINGKSLLASCIVLWVITFLGPWIRKSRLSLFADGIQTLEHGSFNFYHYFLKFHSNFINTTKKKINKKDKLDNYQEMVQSNRNSHS